MNDPMRRFALVSLLLAGCGRPAGGAPFADALPEDVVFYVGAADAAGLLERARGRGIDEALRGLPALAGTAAIVRRANGDWIALLPAGPLASGSGVRDGWHYTVDGPRAIAARTPEAVARFREAPKRPLDVDFSGPTVVYVVPRAFPNDAWSAWCARWRDFDSISASVEIDRDVRVQALARWSGAAYGRALEVAVQAPGRAGAPPADAALWTAQIEHFPRLWTELTRGLKADGHPVTEVLPRLGPAWSVTVGRDGAVSAAVEARGDVDPQLLRRAVADYAKARKVDVALPERLSLGPAAGGGWHCGTVLVPSACARATANVEWKVWLDRLSWAGRVEAWTRYTGAGARVEARITSGGADAAQTR